MRLSAIGYWLSAISTAIGYGACGAAAASHTRGRTTPRRAARPRHKRAHCRADRWAAWRPGSTGAATRAEASQCVLRQSPNRSVSQSVLFLLPIPGRRTLPQRIANGSRVVQQRFQEDRAFWRQDGLKRAGNNSLYRCAERVCSVARNAVARNA